MRIGEKNVSLAGIRSDSEFVLVSETMELLSEHCTLQEAMREFYLQAAGQKLGEHLPIVYKRGENGWFRCAHL